MIHKIKYGGGKCECTNNTIDKDAATNTCARSMPARYRHGVVVAVVEPQNVVAAAPTAPPAPVAPKPIPPPLTKPLMAIRHLQKHHAFLIAASIVVVGDRDECVFVCARSKTKTSSSFVTQNESPDAATPTNLHLNQQHQTRKHLRPKIPPSVFFYDIAGVDSILTD